jgi:hypothetical protein
MGVLSSTLHIIVIHSRLTVDQIGALMIAMDDNSVIRLVILNVFVNEQVVVLGIVHLRDPQLTFKLGDGLAFILY